MACLETTEADVSTSEEDLDLVAADAGEGGIYVDFGENSLNIALERSGGDAQGTKRAYRVFYDALEASTEGIPERKGNAVLAWDKMPSDAESVEGCLR